MDTNLRANENIERLNLGTEENATNMDPNQYQNIEQQAIIDTKIKKPEDEGCCRMYVFATNVDWYIMVPMFFVVVAYISFASFHINLLLIKKNALPPQCALAVNMVPESDVTIRSNQNSNKNGFQMPETTREQDETSQYRSPQDLFLEFGIITELTVSVLEDVTDLGWIIDMEDKLANLYIKAIERFDAAGVSSAFHERKKRATTVGNITIEITSSERISEGNETVKVKYMMYQGEYNPNDNNVDCLQKANHVLNLASLFTDEEFSDALGYDVSSKAARPEKVTGHSAGPSTMALRQPPPEQPVVPVLRAGASTSRRNGGWSSWSRWSSCEGCGRGTSTKTRTCTNPSPRGGGRSCRGSSTNTKGCDTGITCPIHGGWTGYYPVGTCGGYGEGCSRNGSFILHKMRLCWDPLPEHGGNYCEGEDTITEACGLCPVDGQFTEWTDWGECPVKDCGWAFQERTRDCTDPPKNNFGKYCHGMFNQLRFCFGRSPACMDCVFGYFNHQYLAAHYVLFQDPDQDLNYMLDADDKPGEEGYLFPHLRIPQTSYTTRLRYRCKRASKKNPPTFYLAWWVPEFKQLRKKQRFFMQDKTLLKCETKKMEMVFISIVKQGWYLGIHYKKTKKKATKRGKSGYKGTIALFSDLAHGQNGLRVDDSYYIYRTYSRDHGWKTNFIKTFTRQSGTKYTIPLELRFECYHLPKLG